MRVYFTGAHSVGKSTLARYFSEKYNIPLLPEVARMILAEKELQIDTLRVDLNIADDYQEAILKRQIIEEKKQTSSYVSDRSFDALAYAAQHTRILKNLLALPELEGYLESLKATDSFIFFVRPSQSTMKQDGVRETLNWEGIVQIDAMCKFLLEMYGLRYFSVSMDSMQERIRFIDAILSLYK